MKREEAIELLEDLDGAIEDNQGRNYDEAFRMAIKALQIEAVQGVGRYENAMQKLREMPRYLNDIKVKQIKKIPSDAVQGEWVHDGQNFKGGLDWCHCSECGYKTSTNGLSIYRFCPNCGARMKNDEEK